jgi:plasmid stabilization system protein ParE
MNYRVELMATAKAEAEEAYLWIHKQSPTRAVKWYNGLIDAIESLEFSPHRCPLAPEAPAFRQEIRQLLYGKRGGVYRILFEIRGDVVYVLHIRHGARKFLEP